MIWNVSVPVIALVEASTETEAIERLHRRLRRSGFVTPDDHHGSNAFESDDQSVEPDIAGGT